MRMISSLQCRNLVNALVKPVDLLRQASLLLAKLLKRHLPL
jgi:hypothetical protein